MYTLRFLELSKIFIPKILIYFNSLGKMKYLIKKCSYIKPQSFAFIDGHIPKRLL